MQRRFLNCSVILALACISAPALAVAASPDKAAVKAKASPAELEIVAREVVEDRGAKSKRRPIFRPSAPHERDRSLEALQAKWVNDHAAAEHAESASASKR